MKTLLSYFIIITLFFNCKNRSEDASLNFKLEIKDKIQHSNTNDNIQVCFNNKQNFEEYKGLTTNEEIRILDKISSKFYYAISKMNFNNLFMQEHIKCVTPAKAGKYSFFRIYYNENQNSKDIYLKIKNLKRNSENINKYHDFFKRGLVFVLNTEDNEITLITFNIFADNTLPKKVKNFFLSNKTSFDGVFMTTGIGAVDNLIE